MIEASVHHNSMLTATPLPPYDCPFPLEKPDFFSAQHPALAGRPLPIACQRPTPQLKSVHRKHPETVHWSLSQGFKPPADLSKSWFLLESARNTMWNPMTPIYDKRAKKLPSFPKVSGSRSSERRHSWLFFGMFIIKNGDLSIN